MAFWVPAIAVSGFTFYTGDKLAKWKGDVFAGGMRTGEVNGTGRHGAHPASTRRWRRCAARPCWPTCTSASAT